jgi:uncharacterized BrkB/YihY/UPF0761 family membrane protein
MIWGLNRAYEVEEQRPWWKLALTIAGLTLSMAITACAALFLLWLYATNGAILIGGEMNSEIEKNAAARHNHTSSNKISRS